MPPKAAKNGVLPLEGCNIALSGTFARTHAALEQDFIVGLGASLAKTVTSSTTHLVTTENDFAKPSTKVKQAKSHDVQIVNVQWLEDCLQQSKRLGETDYYVGSTSSAPTTNGNNVTVANGTAKASSKRNADDDDDSQSQPPAKKRTNSANGPASQNQLAATPESQSKTLLSTADDLDAQTNIAKSRDVRIPVDEHCPLTHHQVYIDEDGIIYDAALNQSNASGNNNKFYRVQVCVIPLPYQWEPIAKNTIASP